MKYIMAQPAVLRFEWEVQVSIYAMLKAGIKKKDIVILFSKHEESVVENIKKLGVEVHEYDDARFDYSYIPSLKPYLMYRYLNEDKAREKNTYFFMDSDVVIKEEIVIEDPLDGVWYGSDCGGYLNYDYMVQCENGSKITKEMADIVGVTIDDIKKINNNSIGAQYIISQPSAEYFKKVYEDSIKLWLHIKDKDTNLQKWTAEMWSTLWNMIYFNKMPKVSKDMDFTWATDSIDVWDKNKIYHNAGVTQDMKDMFFKGSYVRKTPFNTDIDYINKEKSSYEYAKLIKETNNFLN